MRHVITLPREIVSRTTAAGLAPREPGDVVLDASAVTRFAPGAIDALVRGLLNSGAERVIVVNASASLERAFRLVHRARTKPERTFLLLFRTVPAEDLLRAV